MSAPHSLEVVQDQRKGINIGEQEHSLSSHYDTSGHENLCAGCDQPITDRYLLKAIDRLWHEDCLKCSCCDCRLGEVGSTLYIKANLMLCKKDYFRLFGTSGQCSACLKTIPAFEMVMRAKQHVYHLECFACHCCQLRFCVGDRFYLCENKILCEKHYEEMMQSRAINYNNHGLFEANKMLHEEQQSDCRLSEEQQMTPPMGTNSSHTDNYSHSQSQQMMMMST